MIELLTQKTLKYLITKNAINGNDDDSIAFYKYGIEITFSSVLNVFIILLISLICNSILEGIVFLLVFIPTRKFTGGFHADTYLKCNMTFGVSYFTILILSKLLMNNASVFYSIFILIIEIVFIAFFCPIKNSHKKINKKETIIKYKIIALVFFFTFGVTGLYLLSINCLLYGCEILITLDLITVLGIAGIIKERSKKK